MVSFQRYNSKVFFNRSEPWSSRTVKLNRSSMMFTFQNLSKTFEGQNSSARGPASTSSTKKSFKKRFPSCCRSSQNRPNVAPLLSDSKNWPKTTFLFNIQRKLQLPKETFQKFLRFEAVLRKKILVSSIPANGSDSFSHLCWKEL